MTTTNDLIDKHNELARAAGLTRLHVYKERDRELVKRIKDHYRRLSPDGKLACEACMVVVDLYGQTANDVSRPTTRCRSRSFNPIARRGIPTW